jgi:hypothetical protein
MKKIFTTLVAIFAIAHFSYAQNNSNPWPVSGNVGIGTGSPLTALQIVRGGTNSGNDYPSLTINTTGTGNIFGPIVYLNATSGTNGRQWGLVSSGALDAAATGSAGNFAIYDANAGSSRLVINNLGYTGIGSIVPKSKLHVAQDISMNADVDAQQLSITGATDDAKRLVIGYDVNGAGFGYIKAGWYQHQWTNLSLQPNGGNVSIGTTTPDPTFKLSVNGKIRSKEIKVEATWSDYVFDKDYQLKPIAEVDAYIKKNHHLPDVPSAAEVERDGLKLGEMNAILLKKVEELTLYLIGKDKQVADQQQQLEALKQDMQALRKLVINKRR